MVRADGEAWSAKGNPNHSNALAKPSNPLANLGENPAMPRKRVAAFGEAYYLSCH
jgi:hypothetical protein